MAKPSASARPQSAAGSPTGGRRDKGISSDPEATAKKRAKWIASIETALGIDHFTEAFPPGTLPASDLGETALANLRIIANEASNLAVFQKLIRDHCSTSGRTVELGWSHTDAIRKTLIPTSSSKAVNANTLPSKARNSTTTKTLKTSSSIVSTAKGSEPATVPLAEASTKPSVSKSQTDQSISGPVVTGKSPFAPLNGKLRKESTVKVGKKSKTPAKQVKYEEPLSSDFKLESPPKMGSGHINNTLNMKVEGKFEPKSVLTKRKIEFKSEEPSKKPKFSHHSKEILNRLQDLESPNFPAESMKSMDLQYEDGETPNSPAYSSSSLSSTLELTVPKFSESGLAKIHERNQMKQAEYDTKHEIMRQARLTKTALQRARNLSPESDTINVQRNIKASSSKSALEDSGKSRKAKGSSHIVQKAKTNLVIRDAELPDDSDTITVIPSSEAAKPVVKRLSKGKSSSVPIKGKSNAKDVKSLIESKLKSESLADNRIDSKMRSITATDLAGVTKSAQVEQSHPEEKSMIPNADEKKITKVSRPTKRKATSISKPDKNDHATKLGVAVSSDTTALKLTSHVTKSGSVSLGVCRKSLPAGVLEKPERNTTKNSFLVAPKIEATEGSSADQISTTGHEAEKKELADLKPAFPVATIVINSHLSPSDFKETAEKGVMATRGNLSMIPNKMRRYLTELQASFPSLHTSHVDLLEELAAKDIEKMLIAINAWENKWIELFRNAD